MSVLTLLSTLLSTLDFASIQSKSINFATNLIHTPTIMRKLLLPLVATLMCGSAMAQWPASNTDCKIIAEDGIYDQALLKEMMTDDGRLVYTWLDYDGNYTVRMQVIDANGNRTLGTDGVALTNQTTKSWTTDYFPQLTSDGNLLVLFSDTRNDASGYNWYGEMYAYLYDLEGNPIWPADGILFEIPKIHEDANCDTLQGLTCVSGENMYIGAFYTESYEVPATEENWEPSPWFPDEEMPETVTVSENSFQMQRINANGTLVWSKNVVIEAADALLCPSENGDVIVVYALNPDDNGDGGMIMAQRYNADGQAQWEEPAVAMPENLNTGYITMPEIASDGEGGVVLVGRIPTGWYGYVAENHVDGNGVALSSSVSCTGSMDGDGSNPVFARRDYAMLVLWQYAYSSAEVNIYANMMDIDGAYYWETKNDYGIYGISYGKNDMWGFVPVKVLPRTDGWILFYGEGTSWNGADFMVRKIDNFGNTLWSKQIAESDCKMSSISVVDGGDYAYISYIGQQSYDDNWNLIPGDGGLCVMKVDISDAGNSSGIESIASDVNTHGKYYNLNGVEVANPTQGIYLRQSGNSVEKVILK